MMRRKLPTLLFLPLACGIASAQDDELPLPEEVEEVRRYTVEMIIFTYNEDVSLGSEVFVADAPPPGVAALDELVIDPDSPDAPVAEYSDEKPLLEVELRTREMYELVALREDEFTMNEIFGHLKRLDVYEPVLHFGWTQPTYPKEETPVRPLSGFITPPDDLGLEGDFQLYLGRYLHLAVNLELDAPVDDATTTAYDFDNYSYSEYEGGIIAEQPVHYRIQEDRIFKSGEIRYFDHPKFGVLAKITRWEEPDPEDLNDEFLGDAELLGLEGE